MTHRGDRVARILSDLLSPPVVALAVFGILAWSSERPGRWPLFIACAATQTLLPIAFLRAAALSGRIADVEISRREERRYALPALGLVYAIGFALLAVLGVRGPILFVSVCTLAVVGAVWAVNLVYKASGHAAGMAAYMTALSLFVQPIHVGFALMVPLSWARVRTGAHTHFQVVWGGLIGAGVSLGFYFAAGSYVPGVR